MRKSTNNLTKLSQRSKINVSLWDTKPYHVTL